MPILIQSFVEWACVIIVTHHLSGTPIWIDTQYLVAMKQHENGHAVMFLAGIGPFALAESPDDVMTKLKTLPQGCTRGAPVMIQEVKPKGKGR